MGVLRIILALIIVMEHSGSLRIINWISGPYALKIFFIMSGFYMTFVLNRKYIGKGSYSLFLSNRLLRVFPIYWVVLSLTVGVGVLSYLIYNNWQSLTPYVAYNDVMGIGPLLIQIFTNIFLWGQDIVFFFGCDFNTGSLFLTSDFNHIDTAYYRFLLAPHAWSLGLELSYYLIAPFLVRRKTKVILLFIVLTLLLRWYLYSIGLDHDPWTYRFFPTELVFFFVGTLSYRLYSYIEKNEINKNIRISIVSVFFIMFFSYNYLFSFAIESYWIPIFFFAYVGFTIPFLFQFSKKSKIDYRLGELSYPIYVVHIIVIRTLGLLIDKNNWQINKGVAVIIITILLSYILLKYVSDPVEKFRQSRIKISK
ncbi:acyltransferase [bacterium]|nr:acyltransferase [bacterium]